MTNTIDQERDRMRQGAASAAVSRSTVPMTNENAIQRAVFQHIRARGVPGLVAFHPKNASSDMRGRRRGVYAGLGVLPGVSDVILLHAGTFYALELKRIDQKVNPDSDQERFLQHVEAQGGKAAWVAGLDAALKQLEEWKLLRGTAA